MTKSVLSVMSEEDYVHIDLLCSMSYIGGMTWKHPSFELQRSHGSVVLAVMKSIEWQAWILIEQLVILALAD